MIEEDSNWQDVVEGVFGGRQPNTSTEKMKRAEKGSAKAGFRINPPILILLLGIAIIVILLVLQAHQFNTAPCSSMLNWRVEDIPARCLAELSEIESR